MVIKLQFYFPFGYYSKARNVHFFIEYIHACRLQDDFRVVISAKYFRPYFPVIGYVTIITLVLSIFVQLSKMNSSESEFLTKHYDK